MNQKDINYLKEEIKENFWLKSSKNDLKDNKKKKQTVEDRIINRCKLFERGCSLTWIKFLTY